MTVKKNRIIIIVVMIAVCIGLYCGQAYMAGKAAEAENADIPAKSDAADLKNDEQPMPSESDIKPPDASEPVEDEVARYPAEELRDDKTLPRERFSLEMPEVGRSDEMKSLRLAKTEKADLTYFDKSIFLGDSVTLGLQRYATKKREANPVFMSETEFISVGSYGVYNATRPANADSIHPLIKGVRTPPADIISDSGATKLFVCLGLNDIGLYTVEEYLDYYGQLIESVREKCEDITIIIESVTPITLYGERRVLYNAKIDSYNLRLAEFASQNDCYFADIADLLKDEAGYLAAELSSDDYCHLEAAAYDMWTEYLLTHTVTKGE